MTLTFRDFASRVKQAVQAFESGGSATPDSGHRAMHFSVTLERDTLDGGWVAECVDLPGCVSQGETQHEALENIVDAIASVLGARMESQLPVDDADCTDGGGTRSFALSV